VRLSRPVSSGYRLLSSGTTPKRCWAAFGSRVQSIPATRMVPASGRARPVSMLSVVVLPAPLGPSSPISSPRSTVRSIPATARTPSKLLVRPRTSIMRRDLHGSALPGAPHWPPGTRPRSGKSRDLQSRCARAPCVTPLILPGLLHRVPLRSAPLVGWLLVFQRPGPGPALPRHSSRCAQAVRWPPHIAPTLPGRSRNAPDCRPVTPARAPLHGGSSSAVTRRSA